MENESILRLAIETANKLTNPANRDNPFTSEELSELIEHFYKLFMELLKETNG